MRLPYSSNRYERIDFFHYLRRNAVVICCWGDQSGGVGPFRRRLQFACRDRVTTYERILHVAKVNQREPSTVRYDIYIRREHQQWLIDRMRLYRDRWHWYTRKDVPYWERSARRREISSDHRNDALLRTELTVMSYNINGVKGKRGDLRYLLTTMRSDVVGLQETLLNAVEWELRFPGYFCFCMPGERVASKRGVAVLVSSQFTGQMVGRSSPWFIFVRIYGGGLSRPVVVACVYIPHGPDRARALGSLSTNLAYVTNHFPADPVIMLGDWNMNGASLQRRCAEWPRGMGVKPRRGDIPTHRRGRAIDHIVISDHQSHRGRQATVHVEWDLSDHYPVTCGVPLDGQSVDTMEEPGPEWQQPRKRIRVPLVVDAKGVRTSNYWSPLMQDVSPGSLECAEMSKKDLCNRLADKFITASHRIAKEHELYAEATPRKAYIKKRVKNAIDKRRRLSLQCTRTFDDSTRALLMVQLKVAQDNARKVVALDRRQRWRKAIVKAARDFRRNPREYWRWASSTTGWRRRPGGRNVQPVLDPVSGTLLTDLHSISCAWETHYRNLAADTTGHSRDSEWWRRWHVQPDRKHLIELDGPITRGELISCFKRMKKHKAPGEDGIPVEFLALSGSHSEAEASSMEVALLALVNSMFDTGIPDAWQSSVVVSIPKKGDLSRMDNYRGISLMSTVLKILVTILSDRINQCFEDQRLFSPAQAGFRKKEECVTQVACLYELCRRRQIRDLPTYLLFVDFKKAYDSVPHEALFRKLFNYGIRGRTLKFIRALYQSSTLRVRTGVGDGAVLSRIVDLLCGVRQG